MDYTLSQRALIKKIESVLAHPERFEEEQVERCRRLWSVLRAPDLLNLNDNLYRFNKNGLPKQIKDALMDCY